MKIQNKASVLMGVFGLFFVFVLSAIFDRENRLTIIDKELDSIHNISTEVAQQLTSHIREGVALATTLASSPLIKKSLLSSNVALSELPRNERNMAISLYNDKWKRTLDINDPFIQRYMNNPVADYLKAQHAVLPGVYGEIFLTNRYGVTIATTGKLTTLAHAHKYWWKAAYTDGKGKIFLDDRGYDASVKGYVLGVVVPIKENNKIIGILKSNINIKGSFTNITHQYNQTGHLNIIRASGMIVSDGINPPLSMMADEGVIKLFNKEKSTAAIISINNQKQLVAVAPIEITMGLKNIGFGGKAESLGHTEGNQGGGWFISITHAQDEVVSRSRDTVLTFIIFGVIFTLFISIAAMILGRWAAKPIVALSTVAEKVGNGNFKIKAAINSNDEIGLLSKSLNRMAKNLSETMTFRDDLLGEIEMRNILEEKMRRSEFFLKESQRVAKLGSYALIISTGKWTSSQTLNDILGINKNYKHDVQGWLNLVHSDDREEMSHYLADNILLKHEFFDKEYRVARYSDGKVRWVHGLGKLDLDELGNPIKMIGTIQDITERKKRESDFRKELELLSYQDGLTKIGNRRLFDKQLEQEWRRCQRNQKPISLIMFDVDFFKEYNDSYGHQMGDECLQRITQMLSNVIQRPADLVARYGGEEFVVLLPETGLDQAFFLAEKCRKKIAELGILHATSKVGDMVTVSAGVYCNTPNADIKAYSLIKMADNALYKAKGNGRNRTETV